MNGLNADALDRHITGNWGEDSVGPEPPSEVEDFLGLTFWLNGERVECTTYECWTDADEDGTYGGVDLVVTLPTGRTENLSLDEAKEILANQADHDDHEDNA